MVGVTVSGGPIGVVAGVARPFAEVDGVHYEAIASLALVAVLSVSLLVMSKTGSPARDQLWFHAANALLWAGFAGGWSLTVPSLWPDLAYLCLGWAIGAWVVGVLVLGLWQWARRPKA